MAGKPPNLGSIQKSFEAAIESARVLILAALDLEASFNPKAFSKGLHPKHVRRIVELGFMGVVAAWEDFVEQVFVRYMAGASSPSGFAPIPTVGRADSVAHAYQILSGKSSYHPEKHYLKFSEVEWIQAQAKFYFRDAAPFDFTSEERKFLKDVVPIRNRVAHSSPKCKAEFKSVANRILKPIGKSTYQSFRVGDLLLEQNPRLFEQFFSKFDLLARKVVPT